MAQQLHTSTSTPTSTSSTCTSTSTSTAMYGMSSIEAGDAMYEAIREILKKYPDYHPPTTYERYQQQLQQQQHQLQQFMSSDVTSLCISYLDELNEMMKQVINKMTSAGYDVHEQSRELLKQHLMWKKADPAEVAAAQLDDDDESMSNFDNYTGMFSSAGQDALNQSEREVIALYPAGYTENQIYHICYQIAHRCEELGHDEAGNTAV